MADANFDACLALLLKNEGGYVVDNGGPTNLGVTQRTLSSWLRRPASIADVQALTPATVAPIYRAGFWNTAHCGALPVGLDAMVLDESANEGPGRAIHHLQEALEVPADGDWGPQTQAAVVAIGAFVSPALAAQAVRSVCQRLHDDNAAYYWSLNGTFPKDERGWLDRNDRTLAAALAMIGSPT